jgi:hypothetical protein
MKQNKWKLPIKKIFVKEMLVHDLRKYEAEYGFAETLKVINKYLVSSDEK